MAEEDYYGFGRHHVVPPASDTGPEPESSSYISWLREDQELLVKAYALAAGRCLVEGCEPACGTIHVAPNATLSGENVRQKLSGYMTGMGIRRGAWCAKKE